MTLPLILAENPETPLTSLLHPFDFYDLALALEDRGITVPWDTLLATETGQAAESLQNKDAKST